MNKRQAKKFNRFCKGHTLPPTHGFFGKYKRFMRKYALPKRKKRWRTRQNWWFKQHFDRSKF